MRMFNYTPLRANIPIKLALRALLKYDQSWLVGGVMGLLLMFAAVAITIPITIMGTITGGGALFLSMLFCGGMYVIFDVLRQAVNSLRLEQFAKLNQCVFEHDSIGQGYPGTYFSHNTVLIANAIRTDDVQFFEFGNFRMVGNQERSSAGPTFGYMRVKLSRRLPHMVLKSTRNSMSLPSAFEDGQTLMLEGDFYKSFRLYVPRGYERDALYVFTPDIMALFVDVAGAFNCEIIDDELYLYASRKFTLTQQQSIEKCIEIVTKVTQRLDRQIDYYADERIDQRAANLIAAPGRRLKDAWLTPHVIYDICALVLLLAASAYAFTDINGNNGLNKLLAAICVGFLGVYGVNGMKLWIARRKRQD